MSHFSSIGFAAATADAFEQVVGSAIDHGTRDGDRITWRDPSGAALDAHLEDEAVACVTPWFESSNRWRVTTHEPQIDDCLHCSGAACDLLDETGNMVTRAYVQWLHFVADQAFLERDQTFELQVALFAESIRPRGEEDARYATEFFLPTGMFQQPMQPQVLFGGTVISVERRINQRSATPFGVLRVQAFTGPTEVVFDCSGEEPTPGPKS